MTNVSDTLCSSHYFLPGAVDSVYQLFLCQWIHMTGNVEFYFSPYPFNRVNVSTTHWDGPPIDSLLLIKFLCLLACMLWVIVLHEPVFAALVLRLKEWQEMVCQNPNVNLCIHYLVKYANFYCSLMEMPAQTGTLSVCLACGFSFLSFPIFTHIVWLCLLN